MQIKGLILIMLNRKYFLTTVLAFVFSVQVYHAQESEDSDDGVRRLQTITVEAQKREENILDVPVAVSAISAEALENAGVAAFSDLTRVSPSLTINDSDNTNNNAINLRGIGTYAFSIGVEPSVSVIIDDVPIVQQAQAFNTLNDIARVEVLRGPQGTLFGKNASAGVINIVTQDPSNEMKGSLEGILTDDNEMRFNASISGPIGETSGFRLNAYSLKRDGHIKNLQNGGDLNGDEGFGVRGKFISDFSDTVSGQIIVDMSERKVDGYALTYFNIPEGGQLLGNVPIAAYAAGITPGTENLNVRFDFVPYSNNEQFTTAVKLTIDVGYFDFLSITSIQNWDYEFGTDVDGTAVNIVRDSNTRDFKNRGISQGGPFSSSQTTQEFRLVSPTEEKFDYLIGFWYSDAKSDRSFKRGPIFGAEWNAEANTKNIALFAQGTYRVDEKSNLTGGIRIGSEEIETTFNNTMPDTDLTYKGSDSESAVTGKIAIQRKFENGLNGFVSIATGYKGQGYDISSGFDQKRADSPVKSESSISYEVGLKGLLNNGKTQFSLVGFMTDYDDYQAQSTKVIEGAVEVVLNNVGKLRTQGIEFDIASQLDNMWRLDLTTALINAKVESFPDAGCYTGQTLAQGCKKFDGLPDAAGYQDLSGKELSHSPDIKFAVGITYENSLKWNDLQMYANINYAYQSEVSFDLFADPLRVHDGYGTLNANIAFTDPSNQYRLSLFIQNLLDEQYASTIANVAALFGQTPVLTQIKPRGSQRYIGVRFKASFYSN